MTMPDRTVTPRLAELAEREREIRTPLGLRDTLLPVLISGELRENAHLKAESDENHPYPAHS